MLKRVVLSLVFLTLACVSSYAQCNGGISACPAATSVAAGDFFVVSQRGGSGPTGYVTRKATGAQVIAGLVSFAAPSANSVTISPPTQGVAATAIRADATFQLSQAIVPVWTGLHTFTAGISDNAFVMNVTGGCSQSINVVAPFYICNNAAGVGVNQKAAGLAINIGSSLAASGSGTDTIALWTYIDNTNSRVAIWAYNPICFQAPVGGGGGFGINHCIEIDVNQAFVSSTPNLAFGGGAVSHGLELVSSINQSGAIFPPQTAITIDAANDVSSTVEWFNFGIGVRNAHFAALSCEYVNTFVTAAFTKGCIVDQSHSASVIYDLGTHSQVINLAGATYTYFVLGSSTGPTVLPFHNNANFGMTVQIGTGLNAAELASLQFVDRAAGKWSLIKDTSNNFHFNNGQISADAYNINIDTNLVTFLGSGSGGAEVQPSGFFMPATMSGGGVTIFTTANSGVSTFTQTFPAATGTFAVTASAPLALNSSTGNLTCAGCLTNTPAALTEINDTNVTMTLGGTPATALLQSVSMTLGWTGQCAVSRGCTGVGTLASNGVLYGNGTGAVQVTAQGGANTVLTANAGAPSFSAAPVIGTSVTVPQVFGGSAAGSTLGLVSTSNGSPSADAVNIQATTTNIKSAGGGSTFASWSSAGMTTTATLAVGNPILTFNNTTAGADASFSAKVAGTSKVTFGYGGSSDIYFVFSNALGATVFSQSMATGLLQLSQYSTAGVLVNDVSGNITSTTSLTNLVNVTASGTIRANSGFSANGTAGLASKTCTINTTNVTTGITIVITEGLVTATTTCKFFFLVGFYRRRKYTNVDHLLDGKKAA